MATLASDVLTMLDWGKSIDPDGNNILPDSTGTSLNESISKFLDFQH